MRRSLLISAGAITALAIIASTPALAKGKTVPESAAVARATSGNCSAYLPSGWVLSTDDRSQAADGFSADRRSWVGWTMLAVNSAMQPYWQTYGVDPDFYSPDPAAQAMGTLRMVSRNLGFSPDITKVGKVVSQGIYKATKVTSPTSVGILVWADQPFPGDGVNFDYISVFRAALAPKGTSDNELLRQMRNALSIQCTTQLRPSPDAFSPSSTIKKPKQTGRRDQYNSQLDTFWAHDPETGQNYSLTNSDLVTTGCGSGSTVAVKVVGNRCIELSPGRSE